VSTFLRKSSLRPYNNYFRSSYSTFFDSVCRKFLSRDCVDLLTNLSSRCHWQVISYYPDSCYLANRKTMKIQPVQPKCSSPSSLILFLIEKNYRIHLGSFTSFRAHARVSDLPLSLARNIPNVPDVFQWLATLGLSLSSGVDIVVTSTLCYYLRASRNQALT
jgi:hypothetical protein